MSSKIENRQRYINGFTLRLAQIYYDLTRRYSYINQEQNSKYAPFFVIGSGRCGSTLLRSILVNHPDIHIPPESAALPSCAKKFSRYGGLDWKDLVSVILGEFASNEAYVYWDIDTTAIGRQLLNIPEKDRTLAAIIQALFDAHRRKNKPGATIWGDKTTFNTLRLDWIHKMFPHAKYINLIRDGRDVVNSYINSKLPHDAESASWRWNAAIQRAHDFEKKKGPEYFMNIRYEEMVVDPDKISKDVFSFLQLPEIDFKDERKFDQMGDTVLDHHENVKNPVNTGSIGKWKKDLSPELQAYTNRRMAHWLKQLKYVK